MKATKTLRFKSGKIKAFPTLDEAAKVKQRFPAAQFVADEKPPQPRSNAKPVEVPPTITE